ncbi:hypothetical protein [Paenibacillus taiwanensis]|uniref:hypothetical protein n=1 Tax=Paenibacillus taiwanensis TaxID=401638 RepID=UPI001B7FB502|nr:hypothetical protein [Paenibacillus taiwanensis]
MMQKEILSLIDGVAESSGQNCLTRPSILRRAENKVVQMNFATSIGFKLPQSLITNVAESADKFIASNPSVVKPLSTGRIRTIEGWETIQTNMVVSSEPIDNLDVSPAYFQHYVDKVDGEYRVTIIGEFVFAVRIESSNMVDWRRKGARNNYQLVELPQQVLDQCFKLMKQLDLAYGAFDFIKVGQEYCFLEVNPNGQWLWLEQLLNIPISQKIVDYLIKGS